SRIVLRPRDEFSLPAVQPRANCGRLPRVPGATQNLFVRRKAVSPDHERDHARSVVAWKNSKRGPTVRSSAGVARVNERREWYDSLAIFRWRGGAQGHAALCAVWITAAITTEQRFESRFELLRPGVRITSL